MTQGRRSSAPGCMNGLQYASVRLSRALYNIARKLPPTPRVVKKSVDRRHANVKVADDIVLAIVTRHLRGETVTALAAEFHQKECVVRQWCTGVTRGHILIAAEKAVAA